ncbi:hypothetical protein LCGC14_1886920 [marine sediment metagenome]|uniref:Uncharacterized protein n=1 Tax=marine sediment metagenome TaxID=412755 RepID=A0A0F9G0T8_9ZZZZ
MYKDIVIRDNEYLWKKYNNLSPSSKEVAKVLLLLAQDKRVGTFEVKSIRNNVETDLDYRYNLEIYFKDDSGGLRSLNVSDIGSIYEFCMLVKQVFPTNESIINYIDDHSNIKRALDAVKQWEGYNFFWRLREESTNI